MSNNIFNNAKKLGFGLMRLPSRSNKDGDINIELCKKMVDCFMEQGFTYFDTALMYCGEKSESAAKEILVGRYPRDKFTLTTKLHSAYIHSESDCEKVFNGQLEHTGAGYFDYYLVHDVNIHSLDTYDKLKVFDFVMQKKSEGLVRHVGFSFHDCPELLDKVLTEHPEMEFVQIQLNYLDYNNPGVRSKACYDVCVKHNKPIIIMEPVKGGTLVNVGEEIETMFKKYNPKASIASWAIRFAASHPGVEMVLSGMSNMEQIEDNTSYMKDFHPLNDEEKSIIRKAVKILSDSNAIPCTGCSYCTGGCPQKIAIPKYFALYNADLKQDPNGTAGWTIQLEYYANFTKSFGKASDCISCGQCEEICPQHLAIIEHLKDVSVRFER
ncbi:aldo/keto reductase [Treponema sp. Marseille-Q3903]|uniref:aldo/keto reductase n=1 Tax=Treponema sp. Marseille-Q3903 TaxID=2766703 RepID=UPI0016528960|nr:aldo/keto reductase [Treponema sp. Marseille-Q3903]MBC6712555.1 aldo/keto reductase [Treponema sp. Marseille-Q3903]